MKLIIEGEPKVVIEGDPKEVADFLETQKKPKMTVEEFLEEFIQDR